MAHVRRQPDEWFGAAYAKHLTVEDVGAKLVRVGVWDDPQEQEPSAQVSASEHRLVWKASSAAVQPCG